MEPAQHGKHDHISSVVGGRSDAGESRDSLPRPLVRAGAGLVRDALPEDAVKVVLAQDDHVIEALRPNAARGPHADRIRIGRPGRYPDDLDSRGLSDSGELLADPDAELEEPSNQDGYLSTRVHASRWRRASSVERNRWTPGGSR